MNPLLIQAFAVIVGIVFIGFIFIPLPHTPFRVSADGARSITERFRRALYGAGLFDTTPTYLLAGIVLASITLAVIFIILFGSILGAIFGPIIAFGGSWLWLRVRERRFMSRVLDEMPPFLNRVATSVRAGMPVRDAYIKAVEESGELKKVLGDSASKLVAGGRLSDVLDETIVLLPGLRLWSEFVGQIQQHEQAGGDLAKSLDLCVRLSNKILTLQAKVRAQAAQEQMQQMIITAIAVMGVGALLLADPENNKVIFTTFFGVLGMFGAIALIAFGTWLSRKQTQDAIKQVMN